MKDRFGEMTAANASVSEDMDVQSFLVTPTGSFSEIENLRWKSGIILGSLDWVFEKLFGFPLLNEVVFSGADASAAARTLRERASKNLGNVHDHWAKQADEGAADNPLTEMAAAREAQAAREESLRALLRSRSGPAKG